MSHVTPLQSSFNGGELSPNLHNRIDLAVRQIGVKEMKGWIPKLQGPAETCPGTVYIAASRAAKKRLIPYVFNATQSYVLELTDQKIRFFTNGVQIETSPGVPYEIDAPWTADQIAELNFEQSLDVLYIYHRDVQTRKLSRTSALNFALTPVVFEGGPFMPRNRTRSLTVVASASEGIVTLTASAALFDPNDVGRLFRMEATDLGSIPAWDAGMAITAGELRQSNGAIYQALRGGNTGGIAPVHTEGVEWDGMATNDVNSKNYGVQWAYLHDRFGLLRITGFTSATTVQAVVIRRLPYSVSSGAYGGGYYYYYPPTEFDPETYEWTPPGIAGTRNTWRWQFGVFSNSSGWPHCGRIYDERHCVGHDSTVYASVMGDLDNFAPLNELGDPSRDMAFRHMLPTADPIRWMGVDDNLLVGTGSSEWTIGPSSAAAGIGPGAVKSRMHSSYGSAKAMPIMTDGRVIFIQRAHQKIQEFSYRVDRDRFETPDLLRNADHIGDPGIKEIAYQSEPGRLLWALREDGSLACALYEPKEEGLGWATRELGHGWLADSICCTPDPEGRFDQLWIGATAPDDSGHILRMQRMREVTDKNRMRVMTDATWIHDGAPTAQLNIPWLKNSQVDVIADEQYYLKVQLDGAGKATLPQAHSQILAGLPYESRLTLLTFEAGGDNGAALPKLGKINRVAVGLINSDAMKVFVQGTEEKLIVVDDYIDGTAGALRTGFFWIQTGTKWDRPREVQLLRHVPVPATISAVMAEMTVQQGPGRP